MGYEYVQKSSCPVLRNPEFAILLIVVQHEEVYLWIFPARSFSSSQLFLDIFMRYSFYETRTPSHQMEHGQLSTLRAHHWNHKCCPGWSMENAPCTLVRMPVAMPCHALGRSIMWALPGPCGPCLGTLVDQVSEYFETLGEWVSPLSQPMGRSSHSNRDFYYTRIYYIIILI